MALAKKLRFMEAEHLRGLHGNPSFNIVSSACVSLLLPMLCKPEQFHLIS